MAELHHGTPPTRTLRALPLLLLWLLAAWPVVLWLVHRSDPVAAVHLAVRVQRIAWTTAVWLLAGSALVCLLFPPAPAWLRLVWHRQWRRLGTDPAPLRKAQADLQHFASGPRQLEVARLFWQRGQPEQALHHAQLAIELDDTIASAWHQLGLAEFARRQLPAAAAAFARAEALDPGHAFGEALLLLGRCRHLLGEGDALSLLQQHERRHGGNARSHLWLAEALRAAGDETAALAALRTAAAKPRQATTPEEQWFRALARVRLFGRGGSR